MEFWVSPVVQSTDCIQPALLYSDFHMEIIVFWQALLFGRGLPTHLSIISKLSWFMLPRCSLIPVACLKKHPLWHVLRVCSHSSDINKYLMSHCTILLAETTIFFGQTLGSNHLLECRVLMEVG